MQPGYIVGNALEDRYYMFLVAPEVHTIASRFRRPLDSVCCYQDVIRHAL